MKTAMLLAAGRGNRLRPVTDTLPKPLCQVGDSALMVHLIHKLAKAGFSHLIINHAWLGGKIRRYLGNGSAFGVTIVYSPEPPGGLETGGGLCQALPLLGADPFLCVNADIYTDYDFSTLPALEKAQAHLILVDSPQHRYAGDFAISENGLLLNDPPMYTFSGIAVYEPAFLAGCPTGRYSLAPLLRDKASHGLVRASLYGGVWIDIGSTEGLALARAHAAGL